MNSQKRIAKPVGIGRFFSSRISVALAVAAVTSDAGAAVNFVPYGAISYEHYSNLFSVPESAPVGAANGQPTLDDNTLFYTGGIEGEFTAGRQRLYATAEGRRYNYSNFKQLDHDEYQLTGGLDWALTRLFDGQLGYEQERRQVAFVDRTQRNTNDNLVLETERVFNGSANLNVTNNWRIELGAQDYQLESPQPNRPLFAYSEQVSKGGLKYVGVTNLSAGFELAYTDGEFSGFEGGGTSKYEQTMGQFTASYKVSDRTEFNAALGYTSSKQIGGEAVNEINEAVWSIGYNRRLTGKTTFNLELAHEVNANIYNATQAVTSKDDGSAEVVTRITSGVDWQAAPRFALGLSYTWNQSKFGGGVTQVDDVDRNDDSQFAKLVATYDVTAWMVLAPFVRHESRDSNKQEFTYKNTSYGAELRVRFE